MRGNYALATRRKQFFDYGAGKRLPLVGICAAAKLVYQHKAVFGYTVDNLYNRFNM